VASCAHLAASTVLLDRLTFAKGNTRLGGWRGTGLIFHPGLDLAGHGEECLLDICGSLSGSLQELDTEAVRKLLSLLRRYHALSFKIALVTD